MVFASLFMENQFSTTGNSVSHPRNIIVAILKSINTGNKLSKNEPSVEHQPRGSITLNQVIIIIFRL